MLFFASLKAIGSLRVGPARDQLGARIDRTAKRLYAHKLETKASHKWQANGTAQLLARFLFCVGPEYLTRFFMKYFNGSWSRCARSPQRRNRMMISRWKCGWPTGCLTGCVGERRTTATISRQRDRCADSAHSPAPLITIGDGGDRRLLAWPLPPVFGRW